jgi:hypothetical protein
MSLERSGADPAEAKGRGRPMPEQSTAPDPVERVRAQLEAVTRHDLDAALSSMPPIA